MILKRLKICFVCTFVLKADFVVAVFNVHAANLCKKSHQTIGPLHRSGVVPCLALHQISLFASIGANECMECPWVRGMHVWCRECKYLLCLQRRSTSMCKKLDFAVSLQAIVLVSAQLPNLANLDLLADPLHAVSGTSCLWSLTKGIVPLQAIKRPPVLLSGRHVLGKTIFHLVFHETDKVC